MQTRKLGSQGLEVSALGLGCMGMSFAYGGRDDDESVATIHKALDLGVTHFDTAEMYGPFTNEKLVGGVLRERRDDVVIATKFGFKLVDGKISGVDSRPEHVKEVAEASLKRLGIEMIDLLYQHRVDPAVPIEETVGAMADLVSEGKVRYLGLSEANAKTIRRAHAAHPISVVQSEYSLWERGVETENLPAIRELGIGFVPYSPLGRGFLTGDVKRGEDYANDDFRRRDPRYQGDNFDHNRQLVDQLNGLAREKDATAAQIAIAWLLHQGDDVAPIPGTKRRRYLEDNIGALKVDLTSEDLAGLDSVFDRGATAGQRYSDLGMKMVNI